MSVELRVLLVDDIETDRRRLRAALEKAGYQVVEASSGEDALFKLHEASFAAIVSDCQMGRLNGLGLVVTARRDYPETCRVLVTGHASFEIARDATNRARAHAFLEKPVGAEKLTVALHEPLERTR